MRFRPGRLAVVVALTLGVSPVLYHAAPVHADDDSYGALVAHEYIIELKPDATLNPLIAQVGLARAPEQLAPGSATWLITLTEEADSGDVVGRLKNTAGVETAQPNPTSVVPEFSGTFVRFWSDLAAPADASAERFTSGQPSLISAHLGTTMVSGSGVTVAVLDTGVDADHPSLAGVLVPGFDALDNDSEPAEVRNGQDDNGNALIDEAFGHGTYVAGIVHLIAPDALIAPIRVLDSDGGSSAWTVLRGLEYAERLGADVANLSFGGGWLGPAVDAKIKQLNEGGMVIVAAAGNEASTTPTYPASHSNVIGVNAINGVSNTLASFSNQGSWVDVSAPGIRIVSTFPDKRFVSWGGTSAASPVVAGQAALVRSVMASHGADDIAAAVTSTAQPLSASNASAYGSVAIGASVRRALTW